jgi:hypothetical protein
VKLEIYRTLWGFEAEMKRPPRELIGRVYDGIEVDVSPTGETEAGFMAAVRAEAVPYIALTELTGDSSREQLEQFRELVAEAAALAPRRIVMHSGRDHWPLAESIAFYEAIAELEAELGVDVAHETHRSRSLATPWDTASILAAVPGLLLCCDFSHWVVVCERLLADQAENVGRAASRARHIHARVGYAEGPQVADPADPAVANEVAAFEGWWQLAWDAQARAGEEIATVTPEYGPPPYQPASSEPSELTRKLAGVCEWQAQRCREIYARRSTTERPAPGLVV